MTAIDKLRERDTIEASILVSSYDRVITWIETARKTSRQLAIKEYEVQRKLLLNLALRIVECLAQDEDPDDIPF